MRVFLILSCESYHLLTQQIYKNFLNNAMLELDTKLMHKDILKRLNAIKKPQQHLTKKINVARSTFWRISQNKDITMNTFLKLVHWLEHDPSRYIKKRKNENKRSLS